jgi:site-specific DNA-methyltransferase (adenine-specific)
MEDGGAGASATPVYNKFIDAVKELDPSVLSLIIPAKWYSGGKGLDRFRQEMLNDSHIRRLADYTNSLDVFPDADIAGGVCIFVRDKSYEGGGCHYSNTCNGITTDCQRSLNEFETLIRYPIAEGIVKKVASLKEPTLDKKVSSRKPFGLPTTARPSSSGELTLRYNKGVGPFRRENVTAGIDMIDQWKIIISRLSAEHAGQPDKNGQFKILSTMEKIPPKTICSETYLVAGSFDSEDEADNFMAYLKTKFARFLLAQIAMTQQISKATFAFVPTQDFTKQWTDEELFKKYKLNSEEIAFINNMIKEMN